MSRLSQRTYWLKVLHRWHWISSALCLVGMLLFAATGITLNNAALIESKPQVQSQNAQLAPALLEQARSSARNRTGRGDKAPLPAELHDWLAAQWDLNVGARDAEWSDQEIYVSLPRPGGDAWLAIDLESGQVEYEVTSRGWISYLNDLHKGRYTGVAWSWFIDLFGVACLIFSVTGLFLLKLHANARPATWPMVGLGLLAPALLALLFIH